MTSRNEKLDLTDSQRKAIIKSLLLDLEVKRMQSFYDQNFIKGNLNVPNKKHKGGQSRIKSKQQLPM